MGKRNVESYYSGFLIGGRLIQTDWDFPAEAEALGWSLRRVQSRKGEIVALARIPSRADACKHVGTDGTVTCPDCGVTATAFISAASDFLSHY